MDIELEKIINALKDGSMTISKIPKEYKKNTIVQETYNEIKNQKTIDRALREIEKKQEVNTLKNAPEAVLRSPLIIKAVLKNDIYDDYKKVLKEWKNKVCALTENEFKKFVEENSELYKDVPENTKELLRCGYDYITDTFSIVERVRGRSIFYTEELTGKKTILVMLDENKKELNRFYRDLYLKFSDINEFMEYISERSYDIYSCSCLWDYKFTKDEIDRYNIDLSRIKVSDLFKKFKFSCFEQFVKNFSKDNNDISYIKEYDKNKNIFKIKISGFTCELGEPNSKLIKFKYFYEFANFLKGDLSEANLIFFNKLENLRDIDTSWINFSGARITSKVRKALNISETYKCDSIVLVDDNELDIEQQYTSLAPVDAASLQIMNQERSLSESDHNSIEYNDHKNAVFYYFSDLHLADRFNILHHNNECVTQEDEIFIMQDIVNDIINPIKNEEKNHNGYHEFLLINGDTSRDYRLFRLFIDTLSETIDEKKLRGVIIVFTLGNREYYGFNSDELMKIQDILCEKRMYLLQNEILYINENNWPKKIDYENLKELIHDPSKFERYFSTARIIIFGGTGFKVDNDYYPSANSDEFEEIYQKIIQLNSHHVIVMSHYPPIKSIQNSPKSTYYCEYRELCPEIVFFHGHTHNNYYFNDGSTVVYADNQLYANEKNDKAVTIGLKKFYLESSYDLFEDYKDGIHIITKEMYMSYMRGINISMNLRREIDKLYLLKKNNYNCFIQESQNVFSIMNGGVSKKIPEAYNINYIYDNMDDVISYLKDNFLDKFDKMLEYISMKIKAIGGTGKIHGCIVDIDYFDHVYLNPYDNTVTSYSAWSMTDKTVYPNIASLLKDNCKQLFENMIKLASSENENSNELLVKKNLFYISSGYDDPVKYESTDIYSNSLKIKKMQKLNSGILSTWYDPYVIKNRINSSGKNDLLLDFKGKE